MHTHIHARASMCTRTADENARARLSPSLGPSVEYAWAYACACAPDHRGIRAADPPGDTLHIYTRKRSAVTARARARETVTRADGSVRDKQKGASRRRERSSWMKFSPDGPFKPNVDRFN